MQRIHSKLCVNGYTKAISRCGRKVRNVFQGMADSTIPTLLFCLDEGGLISIVQLQAVISVF